MSEEPTSLTTKELYRSLVEVAKLQESRGEKTRVYREFIERVGEETGDDILLLKAVISLMQKAYPNMKINQTHVRNVAERNWNVTVDPLKKELVWIDLSKPKIPREPHGPAS